MIPRITFIEFAEAFFGYFQYPFIFLTTLILLQRYFCQVRDVYLSRCIASRAQLVKIDLCLAAERCLWREDDSGIKL
ncbi:MAG: hypothetical protein CBD65_02315 [Synechococcus sp. TMED205]|nr:MAG: hypothetical protein CBD65_02315 [Synechococcus sp. TMED205]